MPPLSYRDRFRLAWELTWPLAAIDLGVVLLLHGLFTVSLFTGNDESLDSLWALVLFFVVSPWVIRRAFAQLYGGSTISVARPPVRGVADSGPIRYQESLKVMWLLAWRTLLLMLPALVLFSFLLKAAGVGAQQLRVASPLVNSLGLSLVDSLISILFTPLLVPALLKKRYRGFHLELTAGTPAPAPASQRKKGKADSRR